MRLHQLIPIVVLKLVLHGVQEVHGVRASNEDDLPLPHIVIVGASGAGKSSLASALIGEDPTCQNCTFPVCSGTDFCTTETTFAVRPWLGLSQEFTVVDTPGFGHQDHEQSVLIDEMMSVLKNDVKSASVILLVLDGNLDRFSESLQQMLREMSALFGDDMWNNVLVGVTKWSFEQSEIDRRNKTCVITPHQCRDEAAFAASMMKAIDEMFNLGRALPFAFIDSWAKHPINIDDQVQQDAFDRESNILWNFAMTVETFDFKSIEDLLAENTMLKLENAYLKNILETNLTEILRIQDEHTKDLTNLAIQQSHTHDTIDNLEELISEFDKQILEQGSKIQNITDKVTDVVRTNEVAINRLEGRFESLNYTLASLEGLPLGTIIAWNKLDNVSYPPNWVECDGRVIEAGPWMNKTTPDINNSKRFLRGGTLSEAFQLEEDAFQDHRHPHYHSFTVGSRAVSGSSYGDSNGGPYYITFSGYSGTTDSASFSKTMTADLKTEARTADETRPKNIKVVFLMKCWHQNQLPNPL